MQIQPRYLSCEKYFKRSHWILLNLGENKINKCNYIVIDIEYGDPSEEAGGANPEPGNFMEKEKLQLLPLLPRQHRWTLGLWSCLWACFYFCLLLI